MKHKNVFDTNIYNTIGVTSQLNDLAKFMIDNRNVRIPVHEVDKLFKTKILVETPINSVYSIALKRGILEQLFSVIRVHSDTSIPEILTMSHLTLDTSQMEAADKRAYQGLSKLPEYTNKIIVNATHLLNKLNQVSDVNAFASMFVRGMLVRSYWNSKTWLTPNLLSTLSKSYSMAIGRDLGRAYDLQFNDQILISAILTAYFHQCCTEVDDTVWAPTIFKCDYLGSRMEIVELMENIKDANGGSTDLNIPKVCDLVKKLGPSRLSKFDVRSFWQTVSKFGSSSTEALIAAEYPPYWAHQILLAASGTKSGLYFTFKNDRKTIQSWKDFANVLVKTSSFTDSLN